MKKILSSILVISFLATMAIPLAVSAAPGDNVTITTSDQCIMDRTIIIKGVTCSDNDPIPLSSEKAICCLMNSIYNVVDWMFVILVAVAGIFIIIGAMNIIIAGGDQTKVDTGRKYIMYAAIGLFVAFIARAIPSVVVNIVG